jgi:hypothetical protein
VRGQGRLIWGAIRAGAIALPPAALTAWALRGPEGVAAVAAALGLVVANIVASGLVLMLAARRAPESYPAIALPSYALRMAAVFVAMGYILSLPGIDEATFAVSFGAGLVWILAYECVVWARTPWLAIEFGKEHP